MRIVGGKDYYDGALALGRDEDLVFVRNKHSTARTVPPETVPLRSVPRRFRLLEADGRGWSQGVESHSHEGIDYLIHGIGVWFAGKRYPGVRIQERSSRWSVGPEVSRTIWRFEEAERFLNSIGLYMPRKPSIAATVMRDFFEREDSPAETSWLIENGVAIAIWHVEPYGDGDGWRFNTDGLKEIGFARVLDPYTAFQELSMFVGGVMARPGNPIVRITDDEVLAGKHGFDKWSFRKMPGS